MLDEVQNIIYITSQKQGLCRQKEFIYKFQVFLQRPGFWDVMWIELYTLTSQNLSLCRQKELYTT